MTLSQVCSNPMSRPSDSRAPAASRAPTHLSDFLRSESLPDGQVAEQAQMPHLVLGKWSGVSLARQDRDGALVDAQGDGAEVAGVVRPGKDLVVPCHRGAGRTRGHHDIAVLVEGFFHGGLEQPDRVRLAVETVDVARCRQLDVPLLVPSKARAFAGEARGNLVAERHGRGEEARALVEHDNQVERPREAFDLRPGFPGNPPFLVACPGHPRPGAGGGRSPARSRGSRFSTSAPPGTTRPPPESTRSATHRSPSVPQRARPSRAHWSATASSCSGI